MHKKSEKVFFQRNFQKELKNLRKIKKWFKIEILFFCIFVFKKQNLFFFVF